MKLVARWNISRPLHISEQDSRIDAVAAVAHQAVNVSLLASKNLVRSSTLGFLAACVNAEIRNCCLTKSRLLRTIIKKSLTVSNLIHDQINVTVSEINDAVDLCMAKTTEASKAAEAAQIEQVNFRILSDKTLK